MPPDPPRELGPTGPRFVRNQVAAHFFYTDVYFKTY